MKNILVSIKAFILLTLLCGLIYPLAITLVAKVIVPRISEGSLVTVNNQVRGSRWIAQKFENPKYFWPRPSAADYNASNSMGSNLSPDSLALVKAVAERRDKWKALNQTEAPAEMLFASGSGLDPEISPAAALAQISRVAQARGLDAGALERFIQKVTEGPQFGILGEARVNVLELNLALDAGEIH